MVGGMRYSRSVAALRALRDQPLWRLIAADKAPQIMGLLQNLLLDAEQALGASVLSERLGHALAELRAEGEDLPQSAPAYIAEWLRQGWLTRRFPQGASEEQYALSSDAARAIRFVSGLRERRVLATESRLSTVMRQLLRLVEETETTPEKRIVALLQEQERIDRELESIQRSGVTPLSEERSLERAREIIALADELAADFRSVRDDFEELNRGLRQSLLENEGSRGDVLTALFAGVDVIGETDAGKTFAAFWRLLTDPEEAEAVRGALETLGKRAFMRKLPVRERRFLLTLTSLLLDEGGRVHEVLQSFARSLKSFVQSKEFREQRRLRSLLKQATQAALAARAQVRPTQDLAWELALTSSRIRSVSQATLYDPAERLESDEMCDGAAPELGLDVISELVRQSEIDFRTLRRNVRALLVQHARASIAQVLEAYPADQGFGSVVGYVALGVKHGHTTTDRELVRWRGRDEVDRRAWVPAIYFSREHYDELVD
jgi:hypothetical protein